MNRKNLIKGIMIGACCLLLLIKGYNVVKLPKTTKTTANVVSCCQDGDLYHIGINDGTKYTFYYYSDIKLKNNTRVFVTFDTNKTFVHYDDKIINVELD